MPVVPLMWPELAAWRMGDDGVPARTSSGSECELWRRCFGLPSEPRPCTVLAAAGSSLAPPPVSPRAVPPSELGAGACCGCCGASMSGTRGEASSWRCGRTGERGVTACAAAEGTWEGTWSRVGTVIGDVSRRILPRGVTPPRRARDDGERFPAFGVAAFRLLRGVLWPEARPPPWPACVGLRDASFSGSNVFTFNSSLRSSSRWRSAASSELHMSRRVRGVTGGSVGTAPVPWPAGSRATGCGARRLLWPFGERVECGDVAGALARRGVGAGACAGAGAGLPAAARRVRARGDGCPGCPCRRANPRRRTSCMLLGDGTAPWPRGLRRRRSSRAELCLAAAGCRRLAPVCRLRWRTASRTRFWCCRSSSWANGMGGWPWLLSWS